MHLAPAACHEWTLWMFVHGSNLLGSTVGRRLHGANNSLQPFHLHFGSMSFIPDGQDLQKLWDSREEFSSRLCVYCPDTCCLEWMHVFFWVPKRKVAESVHLSLGTGFIQVICRLFFSKTEIIAIGNRLMNQRSFFVKRKKRRSYFCFRLKTFTCIKIYEDKQGCAETFDAQSWKEQDFKILLLSCIFN